MSPNRCEHLREELPKSAQAAANYISQFGWGRTFIEQLPSVDDVRQNINASTLLSGVGGFFSSTVGAVGNFFIVVLLAIYLASEPRFYIRGFIKLVSEAASPPGDAGDREPSARRCAGG